MLSIFRARAKTPCHPGPTATEPPDTAMADAREPCGCGWFDSSHDLRTGLQVQEHDSAGPLAAALPLDDWLALHLQGWRPAQARGGQ